MNRLILLIIFIGGLVSFAVFLASLALDATHLFEMRWKATQVELVVAIVCLPIGSAVFAKNAVKRRGFEVKPITGGVPVAEEKENDHG